ncbi:MAG: hypothetical protein M3N32_00580 [Actinomycetota bacterium]|nr:hypothetical protein [Actinomycetota bacterium]
MADRLAGLERPTSMRGRPLRIPFAGLLCILALMASCAPTFPGRRSPALPAPAPAASVQHEARPVGCEGTAPPTAGVMTRQIDVDDRMRTYLLAVPRSYSGTRPVPLVLNFHAYGSNAPQQAAYSRLNELGSRRGFLVVTPEGSGSPARWTLPDTVPGVDEVAFVRGLLDELRALWCIDEQRLYATGMSNGAAFAALLACELDGRIAAVAAVAGINIVEPCESGAPVSIIAFHGTADTVVPYAGGRIFGSLEVRSVGEAVAEWAEHNRCASDADEVRVSENVLRRAYGGCAAGTAVHLYTVEGGGHTWPGAANLPPLGPVTDEIEASQQVLDFFGEHPSPSAP